MNVLEQAFDRGYKYYLEKYFWFFNQPDIPFFAIKKSHLRFMPKQIPDRLLISMKYNKNYMFELKSTTKKSIPLSNIRESQINDLIEFNVLGGISYFIFSFDALKHCYLIPINIFQDIQQNMMKIGRKSINQKVMLKYSEIKKIEVVKLVKKYMLNLSCFIPT